MGLNKKLNNEIRMYRARTYLSEDSFHVATAMVLDILMSMDRLAWFHANQNLYRRGLTSLTHYLGRGHKFKLKKLATNLGAKGKRMGIKPGVPDMMIYSHRLTLELKKKGSKASAIQKKWMEKARQWEWTCVVCDTPEKVLDALLSEGLLTKEEHSQK